mmetsp:Transcript_5971/g.11740  ORF Transcript_5971/g.11740 Transcript_5971/m.11740 type:complete len:128 (-) Transcript_5971:155-538(-)
MLEPDIFLSATAKMAHQAVDYGSTDPSSLLEAQRSAFREQDSALEMLASDVSRVKAISRAALDEVTTQNAYLDVMSKEMERVRACVSHAERDSRTPWTNPFTLRNFCALLWPLVLLGLFLVWCLRLL